MLKTDVVGVDWQSEQLHGGTLGDVRLISGTAETFGGEKLPYKLVLKTQKQWARHGDPDSWRREYDLYLSELGEAFGDGLRWPVCYRAEMSGDGDETRIWMEHLGGAWGSALSVDMCERAAEQLGRFQGKLFAEQPAFLARLTNLSDVNYVKEHYLHYSSWLMVRDYIRAEDCEIPTHLCEMLIALDEHRDEIFRRIDALPIVLCHRDFWVANLFCDEDEIVLIDWDTAGWGRLGEDIASLIADEADVEHMLECYHRCIPAYYRGFSARADTPPITEHCVRELILMLFGYRIVEWYLDAQSPEQKALQLDTLEKIYEMKEM